MTAGQTVKVFDTLRAGVTGVLAAVDHGLDRPFRVDLADGRVLGWFRAADLWVQEAAA